MAKEKKGRYSGLVGTVVVYEWRGIQVMRKAPPKKRRRQILAKRTPLQAKHIARFGFASKKLKRFKRLFTKTFETKPGELPVAQAIRFALRGFAIKGEAPDLTIDYSQLIVARGPVRPAINVVVTRQADGSIVFEWENDSEEPGALPDDRAIVVVYSEMYQVPLFNLEAARRDECKAILQLSPEQRPVHAWLSFMRSDGSTADSVYALIRE